MPKNKLNKIHELRVALFRQSEKYNIPFTFICNHLKIDYRIFSKEYANNKDLRGRNEINDDMLLKMCDILGIQVRYVLVMSESKEFEESLIKKRELLKQEYVNREKHNDNKEAGAAAEAKQPNNKVNGNVWRRGKAGAARLRSGSKKG